MEKFCICCGRRFTARDERQHYCGRVECRRMRRRKWQRGKLATDTDYKRNQIEAQKKWLEKRPKYWHEYREKHHAYRERNRAQQSRRNALRKKRDDGGVHWRPQTDIAKMDSVAPLKSGTYRIVSLDGSLIAKMDSAIVELSLVSAG